MQLLIHAARFIQLLDWARLGSHGCITTRRDPAISPQPGFTNVSGS
jgi:hypothetical protein